MTMLDEIREQPDAARRLLDQGREAVAAIAAAVRDRPMDFALIAARGSSDHAAIYGQYLFGVRNRLPVALAAPSIISLYDVAPRLERALVIGISQSGASPDIVGVVDAAARQGAVTVALTNDPSSALAGAADHVVDLAAGPEHSVAATKTYTAELLALAMLSVELTPDDGGAAIALALVPDVQTRALAAEDATRRAAHRHSEGTASVVLGRGFEYATAREWALKLKELTGVMADPYSAADFQHGPVAMVEAGLPILAVCPSGPGSDDVHALLVRLEQQLGAAMTLICDAPPAALHVAHVLPVRAELPPWLMPLVTAIPAQLHAYHVTVARGQDPEAPRNLSKVTLTR